MSVVTVQALAAEIVRRESGAPCPKLGRGWWRGFKRRLEDIAIRNPTSLEPARARHANAETFGRFYDLLQATVQEHKLTAPQIWNVDEKGFTPDPLPRRVVASRQAARVHQQHSKSQDHITANVCVNAAGNHLPPQLIFNRKQLTSSLVSNGPPGKSNISNTI